jgi:hypothetical protein
MQRSTSSAGLVTAAINQANGKEFAVEQLRFGIPQVLEGTPNTSVIAGFIQGKREDVVVFTYDRFLFPELFRVGVDTPVLQIPRHALSRLDTVGILDYINGRFDTVLELNEFYNQRYTEGTYPLELTLTPEQSLAYRTGLDIRVLDHGVEPTGTVAFPGFEYPIPINYSSEVQPSLGVVPTDPPELEHGIGILAGGHVAVTNLECELAMCARSDRSGVLPYFITSTYYVSSEDPLGWFVPVTISLLTKERIVSLKDQYHTTLTVSYLEDEVIVGSRAWVLNEEAGEYAWVGDVSNIPALSTTTPETTVVQTVLYGRLVVPFLGVTPPLNGAIPTGTYQFTLTAEALDTFVVNDLFLQITIVVV